MAAKYPRTPHLPWSTGRTSDDRTLEGTGHFEGVEVVVTEKADGENTTIYGDGTLHARSLDGVSHPSQSRARALAAGLAGRLPAGHRIVVENLAAVHAIEYGEVPLLAGFAAVTAAGWFLGWDETEALFRGLGIEPVPLLWRGTWDEARIRACFTGTSAYGGPQEGYVVRVAAGFPGEEFPLRVAKLVRPGHVDDGVEHWRDHWRPARLREPRS